ncbi:uncharacterized protein LOC118185029 [Stegodyphus dumicola]|uniref:uncharacterized protein LOC118185029 n=1 Tax=Stegodyphus dumicola TaxID=202533 RepID=UPI0015ABAF80|nr:uncharacterized protein LOC118185029 [Stegodyphus dumicola]
MGLFIAFFLIVLFVTSNAGTLEGKSVTISSNNIYHDVETEMDVSDHGGLNQQETLHENNELGIPTSLHNRTRDVILEETDSILYDVYGGQPEIILESEEDGLEVSDDWLILDVDEEDESYLMNKYEDSFDENEDSVEDVGNQPFSDESQSQDALECEANSPENKKGKNKKAEKRKKSEEFYFKHKKYGKKKSKDSKQTDKWKRNCCIRGKRVGNVRRTFLAANLFQECKERTKNLASRMSRSCRWIFWSCCEARALRRYYIHHSSRRKEKC